MKEKLMKLMSKKGAHGMSDNEKNAKLSVLKDMHKMASSAMSGKLNGLKKVTVASDSDEGLHEGLGHADDLLKHLPEALDDSHPDHEGFEHAENEEDGEDGESDMPDAGDDHDLEADPMEAHAQAEHEEGDDEDENMDEDAINSKLQKLMALKHKKGMK